MTRNPYPRLLIWHNCEPVPSAARTALAVMRAAHTPPPRSECAPVPSDELPDFLAQRKAWREVARE